MSRLRIHFRNIIRNCDSQKKGNKTRLLTNLHKIHTTISDFLKLNKLNMAMEIRKMSIHYHQRESTVCMPYQEQWHVYINWSKIARTQYLGLLFYYCLLLRELFSYVIVWWVIVPVPTARTLFITRENHRECAPRGKLFYRRPYWPIFIAPSVFSNVYFICWSLN